MARYRHVDLSPRPSPVDLESQLVPRTFAHARHHLVNDLDISAFDARYRTDDNGAPAHSPIIPLKVVPLAYSQRLLSSRCIKRVRREKVLFIALSGGAKRHFSTIADIVSRSRDAVASTFGQVLKAVKSIGSLNIDSRGFYPVNADTSKNADDGQSREPNQKLLGT